MGEWLEFGLRVWVWFKGLGLAIRDGVRVWFKGCYFDYVIRVYVDHWTLHFFHSILLNFVLHLARRLDEHTATFLNVIVIIPALIQTLIKLSLFTS